MKPLAALAGQFRFNNVVAKAATDGFELADWTRTAGETNTAQWILGHIAVSRRSFARMTGVDLAKEPWEEPFGRGKCPGPDVDLGDPGTITGHFVAAGELLTTRLDAMTAEEAGAPAEGGTPDGATDLEGVLHFGFFHEVYHIGQLALLRRICGKPGFV